MNSRAEPRWRRRWRRWRWASFVVFGLGLALAAATLVLLWWNHGHAERLRADGVPVKATVTGSGTKQRSHAAADYIRLTYVYNGVSHSAQTRCGGRHGCAERPGPTVRVWVDPKHPGAFVTADGNTDVSDFATSFWLVPAGWLALSGGVGIWVDRAFRGSGGA